jgi:hypothetical protein
LMCQYRIRGRCLAGQRQGLQQDKPFRLYGYDFTAGEKPTFLKSVFRIIQKLASITQALRITLLNHRNHCRFINNWALHYSHFFPASALPVDKNF